MPRLAKYSLALLAISSIGVAMAQTGAADGNERSTDELVIEVGTPIDDLTKGLDRLHIEHSTDGLALKRDDGSHELSFTIDPHHSFAVVSYSDDLRRVTGIRLVFFPSKDQPQKVYRSWLRAEYLALHPDSSYTARFAAPTHE